MDDSRKQTAEDGFRDALVDLIPLLEKLSTYFQSTDDLAKACKLALDNEGQLKLLMTTIATKR